jgi:pimeloyl-ACP methyl ester carboxylesterase
VFVHGIFGSPVDTWKCAHSDFYCPKALLSDPAFNDSDVYVAAYDSPYTGNHMTIDEIVSNLANRFQSDGVFSHREVVFVAHSLGGLITQRFLITHRDLAKQVPFIAFYATPETGAQVAQVGHVLSADPLLKEMFPGPENDYLLNLENEWIAANFAIKRYCAYEKQPTKGVWVVDRLSGTRSCTNKTPLPINADHINIVSRARILLGVSSC